MGESSSLPVIAAIPNYNMGSSLAELLPQVLQQGYSEVYVLDDHSTDNSREVVASFGPAVTWIQGATNVGAGANRNRFLEVHQDECIIHFLDADVRLETDDIAQKAQQVMQDPRVAFAGGVVKGPDGKQSIWNYGPNPISLYALLTAQIQGSLGRLQAERPRWRAAIRYLNNRICGEWPDRSVAQQRHATYWVLEGNLLVRRSVLELLGGFDPAIHEYDIIPPARKVHEMDLVILFDPSITVKHLAIKVRRYNRGLALYKEATVLARRYGGWHEWILPDGHFKPDYNKF